MSDHSAPTAERDPIGAVVTAMITPFTQDGALDLDGAQRLADHLVRHGTDTVGVHGTTGESPTLRGDEKWQLLAAVREAVADRATIMFGTGLNDTAETVAVTARAADAGADAVLVVTPYYNRPDQRGLLRHYRAVANATRLPVLLYDVPSRTCCEFAVSTLAELAALPNVVGVKDATANLGKAADTLVATEGAPGGFRIWCGADEVNLALLAVGAAGVVSVSAHLVGPQIAEMIRIFPTDPTRARQLHLACQRLHRALFAEASPAPLKGALNALGLPAGPVRPPLADASPDVVRAVRAAAESVEDLS